NNKTIVTNGDQTDTIYNFIKDGKSFEEALETRCFEPDGPNWTPRISGLLCFDGGYSYKMSILKSSDAEGSACNRFTYNYAAINGLGHFIHTYNCDGNPIPTFSKEPERVAVDSDIDTYTNAIWNSLNEANKISLYVSYIDISSGEIENRMINKYK
ncbi:MAG: inosine monophosphate cyclohydrolase, partial [Clostridia bacterium]|nr:inosine monophosphate cyclohydrolase [Clostridia bacterium]